MSLNQVEVEIENLQKELMDVQIIEKQKLKKESKNLKKAINI